MTTISTDNRFLAGDRVLRARVIQTNETNISQCGNL